MRRLSVLVSLLAVLLLAPMLGTRFAASAQEGTPSAEEEEFPEGLGFQGLGVGVADELPAAPADIQLFRLFLEPGSAFPIEPDDPSVALVVVEEGTLTVLADQPITVLRSPGEEEPTADDFEEIPADEEFVLEAGDSATFPANLGGEVSNQGEEDTTVLVANIFPLGEEGEAGAEEDATPQADAGSADAEPAAVTIADFAFDPETVEVAAGTTVTWTNEHGAPHTATADDDAFDSDRLGSGDDYSHTFDDPGTYDYHCDIHPSMTGTIVVE